MEVKLESEHVNYVETSTFGFLVEDNQFTDVTLVCEDLQQTWVHIQQIISQHWLDECAEFSPQN